MRLHHAVKYEPHVQKPNSGVIGVNRWIYVRYAAIWEAVEANLDLAIVPKASRSLLEVQTA
jgi:hypothetical protein